MIQPAKADHRADESDSPRRGARARPRSAPTAARARSSSARASRRDGRRPRRRATDGRRTRGRRRRATCHDRTPGSCSRGAAARRRGARTPAGVAGQGPGAARGVWSPAGWYTAPPALALCYYRAMFPKATTLGALRKDVTTGRVPRRPVKSEIRDNLITKLRAGETLFPGIIGYDDTVVPQVVNAILSRHNFILLGLRGQAKTRMLRALTSLLDEEIPVVPGCEIHDDPLAPLCAACRAREAAEGDSMPIAWLPRDRRYVEKLATPDVTIADMIGDVDPIKAARS